MRPKFFIYSGHRDGVLGVRVENDNERIMLAGPASQYRFAQTILQNITHDILSDVKDEGKFRIMVRIPAGTISEVMDHWHAMFVMELVPVGRGGFRRLTR